jgi:hypothetical protein
MSYLDMVPGPTSRRRSPWLLPILAVGAIVLGLRVLGAADPGGKVVMLDVIAGQVILVKADDRTMLTLNPGESAPLLVGDQIRTAYASHARLTLPGGNEVELGSAARLGVVGVTSRPAPLSSRHALVLYQGTARVQFSDLPLGGAELELQTGGLTLRGRAGLYQCDVVSPEQVRVSVVEGDLVASAAGQSVRVEAGQRLETRPGEALAPVAGVAPVATRGPAARPSPTMGDPLFWDDRARTMFPPIVTPTRPGDGAPGDGVADERVPGGDAPATGQVYVVEAGDTLYSIARRFDIPFEALWEANKADVPRPELIRVGQPLRIPQP